LKLFRNGSDGAAEDKKARFHAFIALSSAMSAGGTTKSLILFFGRLRARLSSILTDARNFERRQSLLSPSASQVLSSGQVVSKSQYEKLLSKILLEKDVPDSSKFVRVSLAS